jgi:hypothetical protein
MSSHRKPRLSVVRNRARALTLCAATFGTAALPGIASAASSSPATATVPQATPAVHAVAVSDTTTTASNTASTSSAGSTYTVVSGDTLFGIASRSLGNGDDYPQLFKLNKGRVQSDGSRLRNPNLIRVGWKIELPAGASSAVTSSSDSNSSSSTSSSSADNSSSSSNASSSDNSSSNSSSSTSSDSSDNSSASSSSNSGNSSSSSSSSDSSSSSSSSDSSSSGSSSSSSSSGYADDLDGWINQAISVLGANGYSVSYNAIYQTAMNESSGNPDAENGWDSNAAAGTPSIGLMQVIQPTFDAYALPGYDDIWNPVDNIIAAAIYAQDTYGGLDNVVAARCGGSCWYGY